MTRLMRRLWKQDEGQDIAERNCLPGESFLNAVGLSVIVGSVTEQLLQRLREQRR